MNILVATTSQYKVGRINRLFKETNISFLTLENLDYKIDEPEETGKDGVENAIIKAKYYFEKLVVKVPVLTQDDTLFLSELSEEDNPKKDIKLPVIKNYGQFTDENAYNYYSDLIKRYGKEYLELEFRYGHAICSDDFMEGSSSILSGRLYAEVNSTRTPGYFLSDMMKVSVGGVWRYYSDLNEDELIEQDKDIKRSINSLIEKLK